MTANKVCPVGQVKGRHDNHGSCQLEDVELLLESDLVVAADIPLCRVLYGGNHGHAQDHVTQYSDTIIFTGFDLELFVWGKVLFRRPFSHND